MREVELEGKSCVDLEVQNGPACPYYYAFDGSHTAYVRHGGQAEEATSRELSELILQGMNQTFDTLPSSYRVGDVSFILPTATFKNLKKEDFDLEKDLPYAEMPTHLSFSQTSGHSSSHISDLPLRTFSIHAFP